LEHLIWKQLSLSANWSRSFNLPTFNQLFWAENAFAQPNPDLDPEKGESFDLGMEFNNSKLRSRIVCFQRFIKDMIIWQETYTNSGKKWKPINTDAALIRGIELYCQFASKILTLTSNAILSDPRNKTQDYYNQYLVFQPAVQTSVALTLKFHNWNLTLSHRYLSRRYILQANTKWLSPVTLFDLSLGNDFKYQNWNCMLILRLNNIFNEEYQVISNSPMPGRNYIVSFCCFKE
jgi:outer membrane cobalamin receptor